MPTWWVWWGPFVWACSVGIVGAVISRVAIGHRNTFTFLLVAIGFLPFLLAQLGWLAAWIKEDRQ